MNQPASPEAQPRVPAELPASIWWAMRRGALGHCPRCGLPGLFARYLKATPRCRACGQDWTLHRADDFPPYVSILLTGHIMAPVLIALASADSLSLGAKMAIAVLLAVVLMIALLQPAKGAIIAAQWWMGLNEFSPGGRDEAARLRGGKG